MIELSCSWDHYEPCIGPDINAIFSHWHKLEIWGGYVQIEELGGDCVVVELAVMMWGPSS